MMPTENVLRGPARTSTEVDEAHSQFNAGIEAAAEYCMQLGLLPGTKDGTQTVRNVAFGIRALKKPASGFTNRE